MSLQFTIEDILISLVASLSYTWMLVRAYRLLLLKPPSPGDNECMTPKEDRPTVPIGNIVAHGAALAFLTFIAGGVMLFGVKALLGMSEDFWITVVVVICTPIYFRLATCKGY